MLVQLNKNLYISPNGKYKYENSFLNQFYYSLHFKRMSFLPPKSAVVWLFFPKPEVEYGNYLPRVWESITILLPTSEGGMTFSLSAESNKTDLKKNYHTSASHLGKYNNSW